MKALQPKGRYFQNAWVVADLDLAIETWTLGTTVDTFAQLGFMIELLDLSPIAQERYALIRRLAENWDGVTASIGIAEAT